VFDRLRRCILDDAVDDDISIVEVVA